MTQDKLDYKELFDLDEGEDDLELNEFFNSKMNKIALTEYNILNEVLFYTKTLIIENVVVPVKNILYKIVNLFS